MKKSEITNSMASIDIDQLCENELLTCFSASSVAENVLPAVVTGSLGRKYPRQL